MEDDGNTVSRNKVKEGNGNTKERKKTPKRKRQNTSSFAGRSATHFKMET